MNLFGKIFTLMIFFLSTTFLIISVMVGVSYQDWKTTVTNNNREAQEVQTQLEAATKASEDTTKQLEAEKQARQYQLSQLFTELKLAENILTAAADANADIRARNEEVLADINVANVRLVAQEKEIGEYQNLNAALRDDIADKFERAASMTNEIHGLKGKVDELQESMGN